MPRSKIEILAEYYPLDSILVQNDIEVETVLRWLVDEKLVNVNDYFYDEEIILDD